MPFLEINYLLMNYYFANIENKLLHLHPQMIVTDLKRLLNVIDYE